MAVVMKITNVPVASVKPSPNQNRKKFNDIAGLAASIEAVGLIQPIVVMPQSDKQYELVAGERRLRAFKHLKRDTIPAVVGDHDAFHAHEATIAENLHREDLPPMQQAEGKDQEQAMPVQLGGKYVLKTNVGNRQGNQGFYNAWRQFDITGRCQTQRYRMGQGEHGYLP